MVKQVIYTSINFNIGPGASWGCDKLSRVDMSKQQASSYKRQAASTTVFGSIGR